VGKYIRADVEISRENEVGMQSFREFSHLGRVISPGDYVLCYDL
jgi:hypothetical protein